MNSPDKSRLRDVAGSSFIRFLASGGFNTAATYALYLALLHVTEYRAAYTISYTAGIILAFLLNRFFVFRQHRGWRSLVLFPFVYLAQYLVSLGIATVWVEQLRQAAQLAPLVAIVVTVPLTYLLSRTVFGQKNQNRED
ncbi:GtrA family protein [Xanthomonas campestris]|uniref:GtrA family protein n=1 Tax=Xanthomonas campestris pv. papavericola TaxID=487881 RepID=A0AAJ2X361_XANCA|nr:GtrA family protein [Xanthomonas campestris]MEC3888282.1 GtrA family protein [Xanthomonas campestris pv. papavericola]